MRTCVHCALQQALACPWLCGCSQNCVPLTCPARACTQVSPAGGWQLDQLKRLCHNYVLVETWLQRLAPKPLRGSDDCRSNVQALVSPSGRSRQDVLDAVLAAESIEELVELMCPVGNTSYGLDLRPVLERGDVAFRLPADWCDAVDGVDALIKLWKRLVAWAADISRPLINPRLSVEHAMRRLWPPALRRVLRMWAKRAAS